jgi:hypothetical protein
LATIAKIVRSTASASARRPPPTAMIASPTPRRSHSPSASQQEPIARESRTLTSPASVAATASAGSRKRLIERTSRASASRSTWSARPKRCTIRARGTPVFGSRSFCASAR